MKVLLALVFSCTLLMCHPALAERVIVRFDAPTVDSTGARLPVQMNSLSYEIEKTIDGGDPITEYRHQPDVTRVAVLIPDGAELKVRVRAITSDGEVGKYSKYTFFNKAAVVPGEMAAADVYLEGTD